MSETPEVQDVQKPTDAAPSKPTDVLDPYDFLAKFPNAPSKAQVEVFKQGTCNQRVKIFSPDLSGNRGFLLRGLSAREWEQAQNDIPKNTANERVERELQVALVVRACLWTNLGSNGRLSDEILRNSGAGLVDALYELVAQLSDFVAPAMLNVMSADL